MILGKNRVDGFTGPRFETDVRYYLGFKVILKGCVIAPVRLILPKAGVDRFIGPRREIGMRYELDFELP